ncbi:uncharacterized protein LALA0_S06e00672g [Lachancea lanzarotensis]|uniref:LALA0S06e00672g1_1 n=1 Tax=Lachancea lanzarotensis TaxID=1245769 RepID=A0A0C7N3X1_9SACH|nr:uncharacterized protein LALA0_S06e00672g [Lachancea lanzarotensis]CEP62656.1 LALA0S06e00672g1_1 [Lachancea lanzarotensis]
MWKSILGTHHSDRSTRASNSWKARTLQLLAMLRGSQCCRQRPDVSQLPANFFSSKLSWRLHDMAKAKYFYLWLFTLAIFPVIAASILKKTGTWSSPITKVIVLLCAEFVLASLPLACQLRKVDSTSKLRSRLVKEVVGLGSDFKYDDWDSIAQHANEYLLQEGFWHSKHCIYDGEECLSYFRAQFYLPIVNDPSENHDELLAAELYENSYGNYWSSQGCGKIATVQEAGQSLPRDTYHCSLVYDLVYGSKQALKCLPVAVLVYLLMAWKANLRVTVILSTLGFCQLLCFFCPFTIAKRKWIPFTPIHVLTLMNLEVQSEFGESARKWDEVAKKMNIYLNEEGVLPERRVSCQRGGCFLTGRIAMPNLNHCWP